MTWQQIGDVVARHPLVQAALTEFPGARVGEIRPMVDRDWRAEHEGTEADFQEVVERNLRCYKVAAERQSPGAARALAYWQLQWALPRLKAALSGASEAERGLILGIFRGYRDDRAGYRMSEAQASFARSIIRDRKLYGVPSNDAMIDDE